MQIIGLELLRGGPGNWQDSVEDIMGKSSSLKSRPNSQLKDFDSTIDFIERLIPQLEISLQDVEEFIESITNLGGLSSSDSDEKKRKFYIYSSILVIGASILSDWARILKILSSSKRKNSVKRQFRKKVKDFGELFSHLSHTLDIILAGRPFDEIENYLKKYFPDYVDRLSFDGKSMVLSDSIKIIEAEDSESKPVNVDSEQKNTPRVIEELVKSNLLEQKDDNGASIFTIELKLTIEGEYEWNETESSVTNDRKMPDAVKVGYFLHSFSTALSAINGVKVLIANVAKGSVIVTLQVQLPSKETADELIDTLDLITGDQEQNVIPLHLEHEEIFSEPESIPHPKLPVLDKIGDLLSNDDQQQDPAIKDAILKLLNAELENKMLENKVLQIQAENLKKESDILNWKKLDYIVNIVKPSIEVQGKLTMEIGGVVCYMSTSKKEDHDPKSLL